MTKIFFSFFIIFFSIYSYTQEKIYQSENFTVTFNNNKLITHFISDSTIMESEFKNASLLINDLDADGNSEIVLIDSDTTLHQGFVIYVFNTLDDFFLVDSIIAGWTQPVIVVAEEIQYPVIICSNPDFQIFYSNINENYEPINVWKFEQGELYLANEEVYELFINENENLINLLTDELGNKKADCQRIKPYISLLASAYANFINAGETTSAFQMLDKYYTCEDIEKFKQTIDELLFIKEN